MQSPHNADHVHPVTATAGLALSTAPDVAHYLPFLQPILNANRLSAGIATVLTPAIAAIAFISFALWAMHCELVVSGMALPFLHSSADAAKVQGSVSISGGQLLTFKITFFALTVVAGLFLITVGALIFALHAFSEGSGVASSVANGSIYIMVLCLALIINLAIIIPGLLLLQPTRLWRVLRAEKQAVTPRQRFRGAHDLTDYQFVANILHSCLPSYLRPFIRDWRMCIGYCICFYFFPNLPPYCASCYSLASADSRR